MAFFNEGKYRATVEMVKLSNAKSGTDQVEFHLQLKGEYDDEGKLWAPPQTRFNPVIYLSLTEATLGTRENPGWVAGVLKHMGFDGNPEHITELEGWEGDVWCKHETNQSGKEIDRWEIDVPRKLVWKAPEKSQIRKLKTLFGNIFKGTDLKTPDVPPARSYQPEAPAREEAREEARSASEEEHAPAPAEPTGETPPPKPKSSRKKKSPEEPAEPPAEEVTVPTEGADEIPF